MSEIIDAARLLAKLKVNQWKSKEELESIQEQRLLSILAYASSHVPYYRKALKNVRIRGLEDLPRAPLTKKQDIHLHTSSFISDHFRKDSLSKLFTSGSTGTPLSIYHHPSEAYIGPVLELHSMTEAGIMPFDAQVCLSPRAGTQRLVQYVGIFRRQTIQPFVGEDEVLAKLKNMKPKALVSIPTLVSTLAHRNIVSDSRVRIEKIFLSSEVLSDKTKSLIMRSFGGQVYDMYGAMETCWIAWQCEKGNIHLYSDSIIAEIIDDFGHPVKEGQYGNIVLTPLLKRSMPLVRYYLGDRTAFGTKCSCGRGLHVLRPIEGRSDDFIVMRSGRACPACFINWALRDVPEVLIFQAVQSQAGEVCIKIIPACRTLTDTVKNKIRDRVMRSYPEHMDVSIEQADSLPRGKTGKIRAVISSLKPSFDV